MHHGILLARHPVPEPDTSTNLETTTSIALPSISFPSHSVSLARKRELSAPPPSSAFASAAGQSGGLTSEMMLSGHGGGRRLFTASQWQELEHQALIFKYMASGAPVPHDLVLPLRLATGVDTAPSLALPPQPSPSLAYWGYYGGGTPFRKAEDPEPGRCRRTDGKKWRCSREAHGESKYCEKHIHRGKTRSRKPVELTSSATSPAAPAAAYRPSPLSISPPRAADALLPPPSLGHPQQQLRHGGAASSAARGAPAGHATAAGALQLHLDASLHAASPPPSYHRYAHSHAHYTTPLPPPSLFPAGGGGYDYGQYKELREAELRRRHFHALGADLSLDKPLAAAAVTTGSVDAAAGEKPLRRFFDEWPRESGDDTRPSSWAGAEDATQLSISIPAASPSDLAASAAVARYHNGE